MLKIKTHEVKVEKFYATGSKRRRPDYFHTKQYDDGFLSFGYWDDKTKTYLDATNKLLAFFIKNSDIKNASRILNVACGYGTETFAYYKNFKPKEIVGVDITQVHIDYANNRAKAMGLDKSIKFCHGDACVLDFPDGSFSHVIGIEGPAHFNTRLMFFQAAHKVLEDNGELLLTDIILGPRFNEKKKYHRAAVKFAAKWWVVPKSNFVNEKKYVKQLKEAGFKVVFVNHIGDKVFPGYARNGFTWKTFRTRLSQRGFFVTFGLTGISWLLGYLYRKGYMEYLYVKAQKI